MKRKLLFLFLCLFLCFFLAGCGSTEEEEAVEETPVVEAVPETPAPAPSAEDDAAARAEAAAKAEAAKKEAAEKAVADAREAALKAGAADLLPDELQIIDENVAVLMSGSDYEAASKKAAAYYRALEKAAQGYALYNEIIEDEYDVYAPEPFAQANAAIDELVDLWYDEADISLIAAKIDEAYALLEKTKADAYNDVLANKTQQIERQAQYFRDQVLQTSAARDYADYLAMIDAMADLAKAQYTASHNAEAYKADMDDVIAGYKALLEVAAAEEAYWKIVDNNWEDRDPVRFERGWAACEAVIALDAEGSQDWPLFLEYATTAHENFQKIIDDAFKNTADAERDRYNEIKRKADGIKANVAAKAEYAAAAKFLIDGDAYGSRGQWEQAYGKYKAATDAMTEVYETVSQKRTAAQEAIDRAKQRAQEAADLAVQADEIAPLSDEEAME